MLFLLAYIALPAIVFQTMIHFCYRVHRANQRLRLGEPVHEWRVVAVCREPGI